MFIHNLQNEPYTLLNALKIHRAELTQAELTQGRVDSGADLTSGRVDPLPIYYQQCVESVSMKLVVRKSKFAYFLFTKD